MLFLFLLINAVNGATLMGREFWTTVEVVSVEWKDFCRTTATCADPRFEITMKLRDEEQAFNWNVEHDAAGRLLSSHWNSGLPEDIIIKTQVIGKDPVFKFPRNCDNTYEKKIFAAQRKEHRSFISKLPEIKDLSEVTVKLQATCYNVTLVVKKFTAKCPWCPDEEPKVAKHTASFFWLEEEQYPTVILILLGIIVVSASIAVISSCVMCRRRSLSWSNRSTITSSFYSPHTKRTILTTANSSRIPSPPSFASPSPPSSTVSTSTVIIRDDALYEQIDNSAIYTNDSIGDIV